METTNQAKLKQGNLRHEDMAEFGYMRYTGLVKACFKIFIIKIVSKHKVKKAV